MPQAIELLLDDALDAHVRSLWRVLEEAELPNEDVPRDRRRRPHVTLAMVDALSPAVLADLRAAIRPAPLEVRLESLSIFPGDMGVLYLAVTPTRALLDLHAAVLEVVERGSDPVWPFYRRGRWTPHCTLSRGLRDEDVPRAVALLLGRHAGTGLGVAVAVADTETGRLRPLDAEPWPATRS